MQKSEHYYRSLRKKVVDKATIKTPIIDLLDENKNIFTFILSAIITLSSSFLIIQPTFSDPYVSIIIHVLWFIFFTYQINGKFADVIESTRNENQLFWNNNTLDHEEESKLSDEEKSELTDEEKSELAAAIIIDHNIEKSPSEKYYYKLFVPFWHFIQISFPIYSGLLILTKLVISATKTNLSTTWNNVKIGIILGISGLFSLIYAIKRKKSQEDQFKLDTLFHLSKMCKQNEEQTLETMSESKTWILTNLAVFSQGINILIVLNLLLAGNLPTISMTTYSILVVIIGAAIAIATRTIDKGNQHMLDQIINVKNAVFGNKAENNQSNNKWTKKTYFTLAINAIATLAAAGNIFDHIINPAHADNWKTAINIIFVILMIICAWAKFKDSQEVATRDLFIAELTSQLLNNFTTAKPSCQDVNKLEFDTDSNLHGINQGPLSIENLKAEATKIRAAPQFLS